MLKKPIKRKLNFAFTFLIFSFFSLNFVSATEDTVFSVSLSKKSIKLMDEEAFIYKDELSYGKLAKQQDFISWPILDREAIRKRLVKDLTKDLTKDPAKEDPSKN